MKAGIRTMSGIRFLSKEITTLEQKSTNVVANPIDMPFSAEEVVPNVGHIPNSNTNVGFSLMMPFINTLKLFIIVPPLFYWLDFPACALAPVMASLFPLNAL